MTTLTWLKPGAYGAVVGAVLVSILGFSWGGWVTGGSASTMADELAQEQVLAAPVPVSHFHQEEPTLGHNKAQHGCVSTVVSRKWWKFSGGVLRAF